MVYSVDCLKTRELLEQLYPISNVTVILCNSSGFPLFGYPKCSLPFCEFVNSNPSLLHLCYNSDGQGIHNSKNREYAYTYTCHMGLTEIIQPIFKNGIRIGFIKCGQFITKDGYEKIQPIIDNYCEKYLINKEIFSKKAKHIPIVSKEKATSYEMLLKLIAEHISSEYIIDRDNPEYISSLPFMIHSFVESHLSCNLTVELICQEFNISANTIYKVLKEHHSCGLKEYVISRRIVAAKNMLINHYSVKDTAEKVGISDTAYFIRLFRSKVGMTPKQYQLKYQL